VLKALTSKLAWPTNWKTTVLGLVAIVIPMLTQLAADPKYAKWSFILSIAALGLSSVFSVDSSNALQSSDMKGLDPNKPLTPADFDEPDPAVQKKEFPSTNGQTNGANDGPAVTPGTK
jgi:hypothetical protein